MSYQVGDLTRILNPNDNVDAVAPVAEAVKKVANGTSSGAVKTKKLSSAASHALTVASQLFKQKQKQFKRLGQEIDVPKVLADFYNTPQVPVVKSKKAEKKAKRKAAKKSGDDSDSEEEVWSKDNFDMNPDDDISDNEDKVMLNESLISAMTVRTAEDDAEDLVRDAKNVKKPNNKDHAPEDPLKTARTLFLGNVPVSVDAKLIKEFLQAEIESVRFRSISFSDPKVPKKVAFAKKLFHDQRETMNAYVVLKDVEDMNRALLLNGETLLDHRIRVDKASNENKVSSTTGVFVGNLNFNVTEDALYAFFEKCGDIDNVRVIRHPTLNVGKGFGFIVFQHTFSVEEALKLDGAKMGKRPIRVRKVTNNNGMDNDQVQSKVTKAKREIDENKRKKTELIEERIAKRRRQIMGDDEEETERNGDADKHYDGKTQGAFQKAFGVSARKAGFSAKKPRHEQGPNAGKLGGVLKPQAWMGQTSKMGDSLGRRQFKPKHK